MADLDFNELDKAVNSLVSGQEKAQKSQEAIQPAVAETPSQRPTAPRARGLMMDIVHPNAAKSATTPSAESADTNDTPQSSQEVDTTPKKTEVLLTDGAQSSDTPQADDSHADTTETPVEVAEQKRRVEPLTPSDSQQDSDDAAKKSDTQSPSSSDETPKKDEKFNPVQSPFIADAKVDKRPLGAPEKPSQGQDGKNDDIHSSVVLPPEYDESLLALESDIVDGKKGSISLKAAKANREQKKQAKLEAKKQASENKKVTESPEQSATMGAVYDSHEHMTAKPKKQANSLAKGILLLIGLVILSLGVGVGVYFVLPLLLPQ